MRKIHITYALLTNKSESKLTITSILCTWIDLAVAARSYNEGSSTIQNSFTSQVAKKRWGRPPKNKTLETKVKCVEDGIDSYESEEQNF